MELPVIWYVLTANYMIISEKKMLEKYQGLYLGDPMDMTGDAYANTAVWFVCLGVCLSVYLFAC